MAESDFIAALIQRARRHRDGQTLLGPGDDGAFIQGMPGGMVCQSICILTLILTRYMATIYELVTQ